MSYSFIKAHPAKFNIKMFQLSIFCSSQFYLYVYVICKKAAVDSFLLE